MIKVHCDQIFEVWTQWDINIKWIYFFLQSLPSTTLYWISFSCPLMKPLTFHKSLSILVIKTQSSLQFQSQCLFNLHFPLPFPSASASTVTLTIYECQDKVWERCFFSLFLLQNLTLPVRGIKMDRMWGKWIHDQILSLLPVCDWVPFLSLLVSTASCYLLLIIKNFCKKSMEFFCLLVGLF